MAIIASIALLETLKSNPHYYHALLVSNQSSSQPEFVETAAVF
jgi:hypothetical protein